MRIRSAPTDPKDSGPPDAVSVARVALTASTSGMLRASPTDGGATARRCAAICAGDNVTAVLLPDNDDDADSRAAPAASPCLTATRACLTSSAMGLDARKLASTEAASGFTAACWLCELVNPRRGSISMPCKPLTLSSCGVFIAVALDAFSPLRCAFSPFATA